MKRILGVCQGDQARSIQKDFQDLSPCYLKDGDLGDLWSEVPREECSSSDKPLRPMRFGPTVLCIKVGELSGRVIHWSPVLTCTEEWEKGQSWDERGIYLHHNRCYQNW